MADKKPMIVIKKITVVAGGGHGGSWKVALADFMTALMAFFLVMWLVGQSDQTKKAVSDYFSTPSVIEYNFQNFGAEITLEKLFLDLVNEPLKAVQSFMEPADKTPNLLDMGSAKVVAAHLADQLGDIAKNVDVNPDGFDLDIPDNMLFDPGTSRPNKNFINVMEKLTGLTSGLKDADVKLTSALFVQAVPDQNKETADKVAAERLDLVRNKISAALTDSSVVVKGFVSVKEKKGEANPANLIGFIKIKVTQHEFDADGKKTRKLETVFGAPKVDMSAYDSFVQQAAGRNKKKEKKENKKFGKVEEIENPLDVESKTTPLPEHPVEE